MHGFETTNTGRLSEHTHTAETTISGTSDGILTGNSQNVLRLPNGISVVNITQPGHDQPLRIILPWTEQNQYWCTIHVNTPNHAVTCPESGLVLKVTVLKGAADLARQTKTTIRIPITTQGEVENFGVYAAPCLENRVFIGPFTLKSGGRAQMVSGTNEFIHSKRIEKSTGEPRMRTQQKPGAKLTEAPETYKTINHTDGSPQPYTSCARTTAVDVDRGNMSREEESARTRVYKFGKRNPTTSANELPERYWETHPVADFNDDKF